MKEKLDKDFDTWAPKIMKQRQLYTAEEYSLATRGNQKADDLAKEYLNSYSRALECPKPKLPMVAYNLMQEEKFQLG